MEDYKVSDIEIHSQPASPKSVTFSEHPDYQESEYEKEQMIKFLEESAKYMEASRPPSPVNDTHNYRVFPDPPPFVKPANVESIRRSYDPSIPQELHEFLNLPRGSKQLGDFLKEKKLAMEKEQKRKLLEEQLKKLEA